jgi:hypothetical protein
MRIKEIMERVDPAYNPDAGFLRNVGRAGLDRFVRSQLGIGAYSDEEERRKRAQAQSSTAPAPEPQDNKAEPQAQTAAQLPPPEQRPQLPKPTNDVLDAEPKQQLGHTKKPGDVIDVDAQEVPDTRALPKPAPRPMPTQQLAAPAQQLPRPTTAAITPNFAQTNRAAYGSTTTNAPVATAPRPVSDRYYTQAAQAAQPRVNPNQAPVVYSFQGRPLNPTNSADAMRIAQMQAAGVTKI